MESFSLTPEERIEAEHAKTLDSISNEASPNPLDEIRHGIGEISQSLARVEKEFAVSLTSSVAHLQDDLGMLCKYLGLESRRRRCGESNESPRLGQVESMSRCEDLNVTLGEGEKKAPHKSLALKRSYSVLFELSDKVAEANGPYDESTWASKGVEMPAMYKFWPTGLEARDLPAQTRFIDEELVSSALTDTNRRSRFLEGPSQTSSDHIKPKWRFRFDPSSRFVLSMDILGILCFFYELCVVPITLAWDLHSDLIYIGEWVCVSFWLLDLAFGFFVGFFHRGELVMNPRSIAIHYLKGGKFLVGFVLVCNDLFILIMDLNDTDLTAMKALHVAKITKIAKLARLVKLSYVIQHLNDALGWQRSPATRMFDKFFGAFLVLIVFTHIICCLWQFVGSSGAYDTGRSWSSLIEFQDSALLYQYFVAFEFTLAQMSLGQSSVSAQNSLELFIQCLLLACGLLFITLLIAYFSAEMSDLMMSMRGSTQTSLALQFYCVANKVPNKLAVRAISQIKERLAMKLQFSDDENDVSAFAMMSSTMRNEIMRSIQTPCLVMHSLFHIWSELDGGTLDQLCDAAVTFSTLAPTDELFGHFNACSTAYLLVRGKLVYSQSPQHSLVMEPTITLVYAGKWFCEAALWSRWRHVGRMEAEAYSKVLHIDAIALITIASKQHFIHKVTAEYARDFHTRLISAVPPFASFPTDLVVPFTESCELLSAQVSLLEFEQACTEGRLLIQGMQKAKLRQEISSQKCAIRRAHDQELTRVVMLTVVQLERLDGRVYMEVGVVPDGVSEPVCDIRIPGAKRPIGELPKVALSRVMSEHFAPFRSEVKLIATEQEFEIKPTPHYGMPTTFFRAVHYANWKGSRGEVCLRRAVLHRMAVEADSDWLPTQQLQKFEVYVSPGQLRGMVLYAWLSRDEVAFLKKGSHAQNWLSCFDFASSIYKDSPAPLVLFSPPPVLSILACSDSSKSMSKVRSENGCGVDV